MDRIYKQVPFTPLRRTESWADLLTQKRPVWPEAAPDSQAGGCARARAHAVHREAYALAAPISRRQSVDHLMGGLLEERAQGDALGEEGVRTSRTVLHLLQLAKATLRKPGQVVEVKQSRGHIGGQSGAVPQPVIP